MRSVLIRPQALKELEAAGDWYEMEQADLGLDFLSAIDAQLAQIAANPLLYPLVHRDIRKAVVRRFPYCIYFRLRLEDIVVMAIFHSARNPSKWQHL